MMNFKNSKTAKVVSGFVGLATAVMMMGPAIASAATVEELTAQINALLAQVTALQATQSSSSQTTTTTSGSGYQFTSDLTIGSKGQAVTELQMILVAKGFLTMPAGVAMGYFGGLTKSAVSAWQASAGISPTAGYVGAKSRAALNGSSSSSSSTTTTTTTGMVPGCSSTSGFSITSGQSCATGAVVSTVAGCTSTSGFSPTTGQACSAGTTSVVPAGSGVSAMLDATSPMSRTLISPQGVATLAVFRISNGGATAAKVTMIKMKRTGISSDSTLNNVYLYDAMGNRITDAASVSTGMISFSDSSGIVMVPAMGSVSIAVRADVAALMNGQTVGVMLTDVTADGAAVTGTPVSAAEHTIASAPAGITTADFTGATVPTTGTLDAQNDYTVWQRTLSIGSRDALMSAIRFQQIGSAYVDDVTNFRLMVDGVAVGSAVAKADASRFVTFNFATPVTVKAGSHVVKLVADVVGGSGRNIAFSLRRVVDVELWDSQLNIVVTPTVANAAFTAIDAGTMSVNAGTITITKSTDSASGNIVLNGSALTLAKFTVRGAGEKLKVENLRVSHTASTDLWTGIRNGALFLNGVQIGSTATINEDTVATPYTQFNLGSSMVLEPGQDYSLEVRGDVYNTNTTSGTTLIAGTTTVVNIALGVTNVYRMSSLGYTNNTAVSGSSLTVAAGTLSLSKYTAYASQTVTSPQTAYKLGDFRLTGGSSEGVNIDTITLTHAGTMTDVTNLYVVYGTKTTTIKSSSSSPMTWSVNEPLAVNGQMNIAVYGNIGSGLTSGAFTGSLAVSGTSQNSGTAVTSGTAVVGQAITLGAGSLTAAVDASTPVVSNVVGGTMPKVGSFKFTALNDAFTISELTTTASNTSAIIELVFKDGATELGRQSFNGTYATKTGLSIPVAANGTKVVDVYANLGSVGTNAGDTGSNVGVTVSAIKYRNSNGVEVATTSVSGSGVANTWLLGTAQYVYKTKPTITNVALPTTVLTAGTMAVYKFTVTADAGGTLAWRKVSLTVGTSTPSGSFTVTGWTLYDSANESTALANVTASSGSAVMVDFTSSVDQEVSGSKTYVVKATIGGSPVTGSTVSHSIATGVSTHTAPAIYSSVGVASRFTWSDEAITPHTAASADWNDDFLVKNIPTDSLTLTK